MTLQDWLEQKGTRLDKEAVLTNTTFEMEIVDPTGAKARFELFDQGEFGDTKAADGVYANTLSYVDPGPYKLSLIVTSATFQRQKTLHFQVDAAAGAAVVTTPEPVTLPEPEPEATVEAEAEKAPESEPEPEAEIAAPEPAVEPEASVAEPEEEQGLNLVLALGVFAGINVLLGLIGFAVWWFLKKRKKADDAEVEEDAEE
jgi:hypothetical protein